MPCSVRISALALVKMTMHCRSGGNLEVCAPLREARASWELTPCWLPCQVLGMMQGQVQGDTFIVLDSFALPVEGACSCAARGGVTHGVLELMTLSSVPPPCAQGRRRV